MSPTGKDENRHLRSRLLRHRVLVGKRRISIADAPKADIAMLTPHRVIVSPESIYVGRRILNLHKIYPDQIFRPLFNMAHIIL